MKFRYYITDLFDRCIRGTNNTDHAECLAVCGEFFVVDTETGEWLTMTGTRTQIEEIEKEN